MNNIRWDKTLSIQSISYVGVFMTAFLNILFVFVSVMFFAGRLYEGMFLLDAETNFLTHTGVVTTPFMLALIFLIAFCCGVIIFSQEKPSEKPMKTPVGIFGFASAVFLIITSVLNLVKIFTVTGGFIGYDIAMIICSLGLIFFGINGIKGKKKEKIPFVMTIAIPAFMCLNSIILQVKPIHNTVFLYTSLAAITNLVFFILLFKNVYSPSKTTRQGLYIFSLINFIISTSAIFATMIGGLVNENYTKELIFHSLFLMTTGVYSLFIAFYILPSRKKDKDIEKTEKVVEEYRPEFIPQYQPKNIDVETENVIEEKEEDEVNSISEKTIAELFAKKDAESDEYQTPLLLKKHIEQNIVEKTPEALNDKKIIETKQETDVNPRPVQKKQYKLEEENIQKTQKVVYKAPKR